MRETDMSRRGIGFVAADVKKVVCSVHRMNMGGNAVVLDGERSYMQHKESGRKSRIEYEDGQYVMYLWRPARQEEVQE